MTDADPNVDPNGVPTLNLSSTRPLRIVLLIVFDSSVRPLGEVLARIPEKTWKSVEEVLVFDETGGEESPSLSPQPLSQHRFDKVTVFPQADNLGYGGMQKRGFQHAIDGGYDVVILFSDARNGAPENILELIAPIAQKGVDAVLATRSSGDVNGRTANALRFPSGFFAFLTFLEKFSLGTTLNEGHFRYRAYTCKALAQIPFEKNSNGSHFDTQILLQLQAAGLRIAKKAILDCDINPKNDFFDTRHARHALRAIIAYKLHEIGLRRRPEYDVRPAYTMKHSPFASHKTLIALIGRSGQTILDVGCGDGALGHLLSKRGNHVVGIDQHPPRFPLDEFIAADLNTALPLKTERRFDTILLADVLEHLVEPERLLFRLQSHLPPHGRLVVSLPNVAHWSVRAKLACGNFDYSNRGILDRTHLRFFTHKSAGQLFARAGLKIVSHRTTPVPWERVWPQLGEHVLRTMEKIDFRMGRLFPGLFAYQNIYCLCVGGFS